MYTKSILTPLLLLSCATGLYNPIKASTPSKHDEQMMLTQPQSKEKAAQINVFLKVGNQDVNANQHKNKLPIGKTIGVTLVTSSQHKQSMEARINIINQLRQQLAQASKSNKQVEGHILMELPKAYITQQGLAAVEDWFDILSHPRLAAYINLVITGEDTDQPTLSPLVNKRKRFFNKYADIYDSIFFDNDKIIYATSLQAALKDQKINLTKK